jgi:hypothetical protein
MDFPDSQTPLSRAPWGRAALALAVLALAAYAFILAKYAGAVAGGSDSSGYMNLARLMAAGHVHVQPRAIPGLSRADVPPFLYVPLGFKPAPNGNGMVPTYPPGFSLFILASKPLAGWRHAGALAIIVNSLAGLVATYALGRKLGLGRNWAALGVAMVAASPLYLLMSVMVMSDVPSLAWTTIAVLFALKSRERLPWALAAGAALAVDVLLRPTSALAFIPVAIALGTSPRRWVLLALGGLPGAVFLGAHNLAAYGSMTATGYGNNSVDFGTRYVPETLIHIAVWLPALFTPLLMLGIGFPWLRSVPARIRWLLGTWILVFVAFYAAYRCTHETWWYLRFLLPATPPMVVGSLLVLRTLCAKAARRPAFDLGSIWLAASIAAVVACSNEVSRHLHPLEIGQAEHQYERIADWMQKNVPDDAVCATMQASGAIFYYTHFTFIRWDFVDKGDVEKIETAIQASKKPLYAVLFPFEYNDPHALDERMPGQWREVGTVGDVRIMRRDFGTPKS